MLRGELCMSTYFCWRSGPPVWLILNVTPSFVRRGVMLCNFIPTDAALTVSTKPAGCRSVRDSLLLLLFSSLCVITDYISKLII